MGRLAPGPGRDAGVVALPEQRYQRYLKNRDLHREIAPWTGTGTRLAPEIREPGMVSSSGNPPWGRGSRRGPSHGLSNLGVGTVFRAPAGVLGRGPCRSASSSGPCLGPRAAPDGLDSALIHGDAGVPAGRWNLPRGLENRPP